MKKIVLMLMIVTASLFAQLKGNMEVPYIPYEVKMGKGFDAVQANCLMCHSFGYIINQGYQSRKFWAGKVKKMRVHFKAPMSDADAKAVVDYLAEHYGNGN